VSAARIVETVDVIEDGHLSLSACVPCVSPDQLCFDGFEEGFNGGIIIAISFSTHGYFEAVLAQDLVIIMRTILTTAIRMMDAALWR
jgi:hypothetical protein